VPRKLAQENFTMKKPAPAKKRSPARSSDLARSVFTSLETALEKTTLGKPHAWHDGKIGVAVSGGADSVALLRLCLELRDRAPANAPIELAVVHFNHQLRGIAADADERFARKLAETYGLKFFLRSADVRGSAKSAKRNLEDAGRRERYAFFTQLVREKRVQCVVTAHTMDDQAETVLAHILRGTGLAGLGGIHPVPDSVSGAIVRPLLGIRRAELRKYLTSRKQRWREDATNQDTTKTRARIRKTLVPLLEKKFQRQVVEHLATLAAHAREDEEFLDAAATSELAAALQHSGDAQRIRIADLAEKAPQALRGRMVRKIVKAGKERHGELGAQHVAGVLELARNGENGKLLRLPGGVEVRREKDTLLFRAGAKEVGGSEAPIEYAREIALDHEGTRIGIPSQRCAFRFRAIDWLRERSETRRTLTALDCSHLQGPLVLRNWRAGDRLQPAGRSRVYKLKRLLNKKGISRWERAGWPVLTSNGVIVWARGFPVAADFAANAETRTGLVIDEEPL
jgi:tRNA(Ile)-lysidine synthase